MDLGLNDLVVWITGAAGGIGRVLAERFAAEGARLVLHAHSSAARLRESVGRAAWNDRAIVVEGDVREPQAMESCAAAGAKRFGRVDACIVNAGVWPDADVPLHAMDAERIRSVIEINLLGALYTARAFLRQLAASSARTDGRGASIVLIGSTSGRFGERGHAEYSASKSALRGLSLSLKNEIVDLDPRGRVNLVEPGWTVTEMTKDALNDDAVLQRSLATMPLKRVATPDDVADAVLWLSSSAARHVSGEVITVAGGMEGRQRWTAGEIDGDAVRRGT